MGNRKCCTVSNHAVHPMHSSTRSPTTEWTGLEHCTKLEYASKFDTFVAVYKLRTRRSNFSWQGYRRRYWLARRGLKVNRPVNIRRSNAQTKHSRALLQTIWVGARCNTGSNIVLPHNLCSSDIIKSDKINDLTTIAGDVSRTDKFCLFIHSSFVAIRLIFQKELVKNHRELHV